MKMQQAIQEAMWQTLKTTIPQFMAKQNYSRLEEGVVTKVNTDKTCLVGITGDDYLLCQPLDSRIYVAGDKVLIQSTGTHTKKFYILGRRG